MFCVLLAGDAEAREEYVAGDPYTGSLIVINGPKLHKVRAKVPRRADRGRRQGALPSRRVRPDRGALGVVTRFFSSEAVAEVPPGLPSPGFGAHQETPPSSAAQHSLRHAFASAESLPTRSPAEGRSHTSPAACPA
jgi:hypothetical protein